MATYSCSLAWEIPWTEELGGLRSTGSQRVGCDCETKQHWLIYFPVEEYLQKSPRDVALF